MENNYKEQMTSKSNEDLRIYIDKRSLFVPEAIYAAISELEKRGQTFSEEEVAIINSDIAKKASEEKQRDEELSGDTWKKNVVEDENAPEYYSQRTIYGFAIGFGVFFSSILMAINLNKAEQKKATSQVIVFGLAYTVFQIWFLSSIPRYTGLTIFTSAIGTFILDSLFWKKYIGKETKYRAKPIWIPLIVGIVLMSLFLLAIFNGL
jgi:hypothetical protein